MIIQSYIIMPSFFVCTRTTKKNPPPRRVRPSQCHWPWPKIAGEFPGDFCSLGFVYPGGHYIVSIISHYQAKQCTCCKGIEFEHDYYMMCMKFDPSRPLGFIINKSMGTMILMVFWLTGFTLPHTTGSTNVGGSVLLNDDTVYQFLSMRLHHIFSLIL